MALQNYTPMRLAPALDPTLRHELLKVDIFLRQLTPFAARVPTFPQGTSAGSVDLTQFLFLPGRSPRQRALGNVTFSAGTVEQGSALDDSIVRGFALQGAQVVGGIPTTHTVYFQPDGDTNTTIVRKWIFPSITSSPTDTFTFAATSGVQTFVGKTLTSGTIWVGTNAAANTFRSSTNGTAQEFTVSPNTGFPNIVSVQTKPTLRLPSLDVSVPTTDRHTFMMLHASITAPFTSGSIAHGNHDGTEMQMLAAGASNGLALRYNTGETVAATSWTNGGTTVSGAFDITKTRAGMRIRGNSGLSIYVDEDTTITSVDITGTFLTVNTPLVGNNVATVTVQTWGPTWDSALAGVSHSSLADLTTSDDHPQYLYIPGRSGGQKIGSQTHSSGLFQDLAIEGRLLLGDGLFGINYTTGRVLDIRHSLGNNVNYINVLPTVSTPTGAASGGIILLNVQPAAVGYTSGSYSYTGFRFLNTGVVAPSGVTCTSAVAMNVQSAPGEGGDPGSGGTFGKVNIIRGATITAQGSSGGAVRDISVTTAAGSTAITSAGLFVAPIVAGLTVVSANIPIQILASITDASNAVLTSGTGVLAGTVTTSFSPLGTEVTGARVQVSGRLRGWSDLFGLDFEDGTGGNIYATRATILNVGSMFNTTGVQVWSLLKMATTISNPVAVWMFDISAVNNSRHAGMFSIGSTATPTRWVDLGAGTTTIAPLGFASGTNKTTAASGDVEYDGSYWYLTHSDAVRTTNVTQRGIVNLTAQSAAIGATTLYTPPAAGYYVVHYTLEDTTADVTAGTIQFQINYTDDIGATTQTGAALAMTATGRDRGSFQVWNNSGVISYQTNLVGIFGTARYALRVRLESLG